MLAFVLSFPEGSLGSFSYKSRESTDLSAYFSNARAKEIGLILAISGSFIACYAVVKKYLDAKEIPEPCHIDARYFNSKSESELTLQVEDEFQSGVYVRKVFRPKDEVKYIIGPKIMVKKSLIREDNIASYWTSATLVRKDLPLYLYNTRFASHGTGLVLSVSSRLMLFTHIDGGFPTKNAAKKYVDLQLRPGSQNIVASHYGTINRFFLEKYQKYENDLKVIKRHLKEMSEDIRRIPRSLDGTLQYNEAFIHFRTEDILAVLWDKDSKQDISEAVKFRLYLKRKYGIDFPIFKYSSAEGGRLTKVRTWALHSSHSILPERIQRYQAR